MGNDELTCEMVSVHVNWWVYMGNHEFASRDFLTPQSSISLLCMLIYIKPRGMCSTVWCLWWACFSPARHACDACGGSHAPCAASHTNPSPFCNKYMTVPMVH